MARSQLNHSIFSMITGHSSVTARSQLNHGPGHGSVTDGCDYFAHRELTVGSRWAVTVANFFLMGTPSFVSIFGIQKLNQATSMLYFDGSDYDCLWLTQSGLLSQYGDIDLGQYCLMECLGAWWHKLPEAIWTSHWDQAGSVAFIREQFDCVPKLLFCIMSLKIIPSRLLPHLPCANELNNCNEIVCSHSWFHVTHVPMS